MIIGFEAKRIYQNTSGLGNYGRNLVNMLVEYFPEHRYKLFAPKVTPLFNVPSPVEVIAPETFLWKKFGNYWRRHGLASLYTQNRLDLFHGLSHVIPSSIYSTGIPTAVTIHDLIFLRFPHFYKRFDRAVYESLTRKSCEKSTKILAISHQTKADITHFFGTDPAKIEVIHQSCNPLFYQPVDQETKMLIRAKLLVPEQFMLCVGTIEQRKNQLTILKAMVHGRIKTPLVILGKPTSYIYELKKFIREEGLISKVFFLHGTTTEELQALYQMADLTIYTSEFEGFGLPVLEAQASNCPVITSNLSSLPEAGGEGAIYVDPKDYVTLSNSIEHLLSDKSFRNDMIHKGALHAEQLSKREVAFKMMKFYRDLIAER